MAVKKTQVAQLTNKLAAKAVPIVVREHREPPRAVPVKLFLAAPAAPKGAAKPVLLVADYVDEPLLTAKEAAEVLGCCVTTIQRYSRRELIPFVRFGTRGRRYRTSTLLRLKVVPTTNALTAPKKGRS